MKRVFFPGEEWLYLKIYMGPDTADAWLSEVLPNMLDKLYSAGKIKSSFYIRYLDPLFHVRVRFLLSNSGFTANVIQLLNESSGYYIGNELIWKIELGTYDREVERYGREWIGLAEEIFSADSKFWLKLLPGFRSDADGETKRWQSAFLSAHNYFEIFGFHTEERLELLKRMESTLYSEFGNDRKQKLKIDNKYRQYRDSLERLADKPDEIGFTSSESTIFERSESIKQILHNSIESIQWDNNEKFAKVSDFIHMSLNRGLRSKHRMHELLIYTFLRKYYLSKSSANK